MHACEKAGTALLLLERSTGRVLEVNAAFLRMTGRRSDEIVGHNFWEPPLIADAAAGAEIHEHLRAGGPVQGVDLPLMSADERWLWLEVSGTPAGGLIRLEVRDATAREQSRLARRMEALRSLARRTAGEFQDLHRTLLSVNAGDEVRQAAARAGNIASQLLAFSGDLELQPRQICLNDLIEAMLPNLRRMFGREIELVCDLSPDLEPVWADPAQVSRIILQLAANSREAMHRAGTFRIETRNSSAIELGINGTSDGSYAVLAISDTGPGLDDPSWEHLFEPFSSTRPDARGRGLELAAVYGIVRQSGGRLWAYSQPGEGATFRVYLPRPGEHFPSLPSDPPGTAQRDTTILLVEANDGLRSVLANLLKRRGYRVFPAIDPEDALRAADAHGSPDLLISRPAPELVRHLLQVRPHLRVLFLESESGTPIPGMPPSMAILRKPFEPETLLSAGTTPVVETAPCARLSWVSSLWH